MAPVAVCVLLVLTTMNANVTVSMCTFNAKKGHGHVFRSVCFSIRSGRNINIMCAGGKRCTTVLHVRGPISGCSTSVSKCCRCAQLFATVTRALNRKCTLRGRSVFIHGPFYSRDRDGHRCLSRSCFRCFGNERCASDRACLAIARRTRGDHLFSFSNEG